MSRILVRIKASVMLFHLPFSTLFFARSLLYKMSLKKVKTNIKALNCYNPCSTAVDAVQLGLVH